MLKWRVAKKSTPLIKFNMSLFVFEWSLCFCIFSVLIKVCVQTCWHNKGLVFLFTLLFLCSTSVASLHSISSLLLIFQCTLMVLWICTRITSQDVEKSDEQFRKWDEGSIICFKIVYYICESINHWESTAPPHFLDSEMPLWELYYHWTSLWEPRTSDCTAPLDTVRSKIIDLASWDQTVDFPETSFC